MMQSKIAARNDAQQDRKYEPLSAFDPRTGATTEIFFADPALAASFGMGGAGWYFWSSWPGCRPGRPTGPFGTSYAAYRDALFSNARGFDEAAR
jgi:hypothetical protein